MPDLLVLCYHAVSERWPASLSVTPERFDDQLEALHRRGYQGVTFAEAVSATATGKRVAVTFDDGFRSVLELAFPALAAVGWPATLFVPTDLIGRPGPMAWAGTDQWVATEHERELHGLSWDEARQLADAGWEIGSHTRTHPHLTRLDDAQLTDELETSRARCADELGRPCRTFAYPYGDLDERVVAAVGAAGYEAAAALPKQFSRPQPLTWPRVGIWHKDDRLRFRLKTSSAVRTLRLRLGR